MTPHEFLASHGVGLMTLVPVWLVLAFCIVIIVRHR